MKLRILSPLFALLLIVSACSDEPQATGPATGSDVPNAVIADIGALDLTLEQAALIDEMFFMEEDLSLLLDHGQLMVFDVLTNDGGGRFDRRMGIDLAAVIYFNLIAKANPDMSEEMLAQIRELIAASNQLRQRILQSGKSREEIAQLLKDEHNRLIRQINQLIGPEAIANVERLKRQLEQERKDRRDDWRALRIDREVQAMQNLLGLTDEQAAQVKRILMSQYEEIAKLREQYKDNPEGFREALKDLQARIDRLMTQAIGDKWARWKELRQRRINPGDDDRGSGVSMRLRHLTEILQLTDRQQAAVKDILIQQQKMIQQLIQRYGRDRAGLAEALKALQAKIDRQIASLLTPEQLERWKRFRAGGSDRGGLTDRG